MAINAILAIQNHKFPSFLENIFLLKICIAIWLQFAKNLIWIFIHIQNKPNMCYMGLKLYEKYIKIGCKLYHFLIHITIICQKSHRVSIFIFLDVVHI